MKEQILDFITNNEKHRSSDEIIEAIELTCDMIKRAMTEGSSVMGEALLQSNRALGKANGYTEYIRQDFAVKLGLTKTAVKYLVNELLKEEQIEVVKYENITFLRVKK